MTSRIDMLSLVATVGENVRRLREEAGHRHQGQFAESIGVAQQWLSDLENNRYLKPDITNLMKIAAGIPCSIERLLEGVDAAYDRAMLIHLSDIHLASSDAKPNGEHERVDVSGYTRDDIPVVAEGEGSPQGSLFWSDDGKLQSDVEDRITRPFDISDPRAYGVRIRGDSMIPLYAPGSIIVVSPHDSVQDGDRAYVQLLSGERLVKTVRAVPGGWMLESFNPAYQPRYVKKAEIGALHRIVWAREPRRGDRVVAAGRRVDRRSSQDRRGTERRTRGVSRERHEETIDHDIAAGGDDVQTDEGPSDEE